MRLNPIGVLFMLLLAALAGAVVALVAGLGWGVVAGIAVCVVVLGIGAVTA